MPSAATLDAFIAQVERNDHVQAIQDWYTEDATMRENMHPPRVGMAALVANEERAMAATREVRSTCVRPVFVDGDLVVIRWIFEFQLKNGGHFRMEELAYQRWRGDKICEEQFFYDPVQMKPSPGSA